LKNFSRWSLVVRRWSKPVFANDERPTTDDLMTND
jgi:hypothetical protein